MHFYSLISYTLDWYCRFFFSIVLFLVHVLCSLFFSFKENEKKWEHIMCHTRNDSIRARYGFISSFPCTIFRLSYHSLTFGLHSWKNHTNVDDISLRYLIQVQEVLIISKWRNFHILQIFVLLAKLIVVLRCSHFFHLP